jgi:hypothetical protein
LRESRRAAYAPAMRFGSPYLRAGLAFAVVVLGGGWMWLDWDAKLDGFAGFMDRRTAHAAGILAGAEWRNMRAAGDLAPGSSGGDGCAKELCLTAQATLGGRWAGGGGTCANGDAYRFADGYAEITSHADGKPTTVVRRAYRIVAAPVALRLLRDRDGKHMERSVTKLPGDVEVATLGRSAYVRRIFRALDKDAVRLILVEQRTARSGPASALILEGRPTGGGDEVVYRRCAG